jgi:hypothetical protein
MWPCMVTNFFVTEPSRCTNFTNLFCYETLHVSDSSSVHHQEVIHCTLSIGIYHTAFVDSWKAVYKPAWHIPLLSVQWINSWWWTDELSETCRVSWQNKFVKLVHLLGFVTKKVELIVRNFEAWDIGWENNNNEKVRDVYNKNIWRHFLCCHVRIYSNHFTFLILYPK